MRSLFIKSSIIIFLILAMGGGLTMASTSSEPGMFLYPLKQTTRRLIGVFERASGNELPAIVIPQDSPDPGGDTPGDRSPANVEDNQLYDDDRASIPEIPEPVGTATPGQGKETPVPVPTTAHASDTITATLELVGRTQPDANIYNNSDPGGSRPGTSYADDQNEDSPGNDRPEDGLNDGQPEDSSDDHPDSDQHQDDSSPDRSDDSPTGDQHDDSGEDDAGHNSPDGD